jgi:hypothetical protein
MRIVLRGRILALASVACSAFLIATCIVKAQQQTDAKPSEAEESLKQFLHAFDGDKTTRYVPVFRDLNSDGTLEAIVYLMGREWCGSGGCNTLILTPRGSSWKIVAKITLTRPPIRVLSATSNGWRNIGVWVQGGSIQPGYEAQLRFDGKTYPSNPSALAAQRLNEKPAGEVVIPLSPDAKPLYDDHTGAGSGVR